MTSCEGKVREILPTKRSDDVPRKVYQWPIQGTREEHTCFLIRKTRTICYASYNSTSLVT